jgi:hypothetical protein
MENAPSEPIPSEKPSLVIDHTNVHVVKTEYRGGLWRVTVGARGLTNTALISFDQERYGGNHRVGNIPFRYRITWGE